MAKVRLPIAQVTGNARFEPWIGDYYRVRRDDADDSCCDGLWHVMGESHYGDEEEPGSDATRRVVRELAIPGYRFFDVLLSVVAGQSVELLDREAEWSKLAYSNFVQDLLPSDARRPQKVHWQAGRDAFFAQLAMTCPKQLLVVGRENWDNLPVEGFTPVPPFTTHLQDEPVDGVGIYGFCIGDQAHFTVATWMYHPSSRGLLDIAAAARRVQSVAMVSCNILSALERDDEGWFYHSD